MLIPKLEMTTMIQPSVLDTQSSIEAELDRLTYSAYLLTLDPAKAISAVTSAVDGSLEKRSPRSDLQRRTVELSVCQLQPESGVAWDEECSRCDLVLHAGSGLARAKRVTSFEEEMRSNPILSLSSGSRIAFVLHHVLGYSLEQSALLVEMNDKTFRARLRSAYIEMTSHQLRHGSYFADIVVQSTAV
jgi:hypothetical protein